MYRLRLPVERSLSREPDHQAADREMGDGV